MKAFSGTLTSKILYPVRNPMDISITLKSPWIGAFHRRYNLKAAAPRRMVMGLDEMANGQVSKFGMNV